MDRLTVIASGGLRSTSLRTAARPRFGYEASHSSNASPYAEECAIGPFHVVNPESDPVVVSEVELGGVAVQMAFAHVEIATIDTALEDQEVIFGSVGVPEEGADVFLGAVVHRAMTSELPSDGPIDRAFVGHQVTRAINVCGHYRSEGLSGDVRDVEAADSAIALDQR